jgi:hypothetical protein
MLEGMKNGMCTLEESYHSKLTANQDTCIPVSSATDVELASWTKEDDICFSDQHGVDINHED